MSSTESWAFHDTSTECAICLEPLEDVDHNSEDTTSKNISKISTIRLACGHRWHLQCLREQLELARPTSTNRLLFSGCRCAKCGTVCEHKALEEYTRTTDILRQKVNELLVEQLNNDVASLSSSSSDNKRAAKQNHNDTNESLLLAWKKVQNSENPKNTTNQEQVLREARKKYAFYLCSHCKEPYFGGTVECSDGMVEEEELPDAEPRLCMACTPQVVCRAPMEHLGSIVWKCRYCCQPATHVCYGNVHFCDPCHDRNSERVQQLQVWKQEERLARRNGKNNNRCRMEPPSPLEPIPCPGKDCPFPKPLLSSSSTSDNGNNLAVGLSNTSSSSTSDFHTNGSTANCEQVDTCLICQSSTEEQELQHLGSHNLLSNPSGGLGLQGWQQLNRRRSWQVEDSDWPVNPLTTTNFVSSFEPCIMSQVVDLGRLAPDLVSRHQEVEAGLPFRTYDFAVEVSARYQARTDCPSVFRLEAIALDRNQRPLQRLQTAALEAPPDHWGKAELVLEHLSLERIKYVAIVITGKDQRFWNGNYGSKASDCSVRILWENQNHTNNNATRDRNIQNEALTRNRTVANVAASSRSIQQQRQQQRDYRRPLRRNRRIQQPPENPRDRTNNDEVRPRQQEQPRNWILFDLILPVLCFAALAWLAAK